MGLLHTLGCSTFAVSLTINTFLTRSGPAVNIILAIMLHPLLRSVATTTKSQSVKAFTSRTGALGIAAVVVVIGFYIMDEQLRVDFTTSADKKLDRKWMKWIFSLMMSPLSFSYIVFFLRLDYALSNHNDGPTSALQTPEKGEGGSSDGKRNRGILVPPASCFTSLRKPYYTASWLGYVAAAFCLALLCSVPISKGLPLIKLDDCDTIGFYLAFIAPTLMCTFVIILAFFRGEFGRVWNYEDKWTVGGKGSKETDHA
ncbi:hypothetical protein SCHPADRAFT_93141 [Schizopora paradoxa]|uniref:Uncharacterized protein n=1 Tax=Schizopora paradoxa TaxID=27342 RepID=A0A0H2S3V0_9AGAM|nr:hypothetical protein SCHPADRAFT_93141 [Schizopora paradoxa]